MSDRADVYRKRADECRNQADRTTDRHLKQQYLDMANGWLKLARHAEQWEKKFKGEE